MIKHFILWAVRHCRADRQRLVRTVVTFDDKFLFKRFEFVWPDEWPDSWFDQHRELCIASGRPVPRKPNRPPWWRPFNLFLHRWNPEAGTCEAFHDHPRWSVTFCLRGQIIEHTPWGSRLLTAGALAIRSRKAIHAFEVPPGYSGKTWTLFIVGRRNHRQNTFTFTKR